MLSMSLSRPLLATWQTKHCQGSEVRAQIVHQQRLPSLPARFEASRLCAGRGQLIDLNARFPQVRGCRSSASAQVPQLGRQSFHRIEPKIGLAAGFAAATWTQHTKGSSGSVRLLGCCRQIQARRVHQRPDVRHGSKPRRTVRTSFLRRGAGGGSLASLAQISGRILAGQT